MLHVKLQLLLLGVLHPPEHQTLAAEQPQNSATS